MIRVEADHFVSYGARRQINISILWFMNYVDDIVITDDDHEGIKDLKQHLFQHFQTNDLGHLHYFLGNEVAQSKSGIAVS